MKLFATLFTLLFCLLSFASGRTTVELTRSLSINTTNSGGDLVEVIEVPRGSIISYRENTLSAGLYRSILIHHIPGSRVSQSEIDRINGLKLYISERVKEISQSYGYNLNQNERVDLVRQLINNCSRRNITTSIITINGVRYEVSNDNVSQLPNGTYVPLTVPEARDLASACGFDIPTASQLQAIARHAFDNGNMFVAITRTPNDDNRTQLLSMNEMMSDPRMRIRSNVGRSALIDGHFKWYDNGGRIYGFAKSSRSFSFYHNRASGAHVSQTHYYDYSHGLRLIRRVR